MAISVDFAGLLIKVPGGISIWRPAHTCSCPNPYRAYDTWGDREEARAYLFKLLHKLMHESVYA